jgi:hypothetical protein
MTTDTSRGPGQSPEDDPAYQAWLADLATQCLCSDKPCGGLMAGGFCDELTWDAYDVYVDLDSDDQPDPDDL